MTSEAVAESVPNAKGRIAPFGKYLLLQRVSVGGMAEIFKAIPEGATRIDQIVAVKRILPNIAEDSEFIGMFVDEARIAGQLTHPNICRIYELGRVGNDHYIAMQFLWGRDLLKVMNRLKKAGEVIPVPMAAFVAARACSALHYAHTKRDAAGRPLNIIHRDVSPQNIIVGYSGQVKLIDFGVARAATQSQRTQAGILKGKFGYMSPEMIRSLPVDHRSDVFAMGICLHEALTGSRLFYGETDFATLEQVRDARVLPPSAKVPAVPPALDAIVLKALARDAEDRFSTAQEMEQALDEFLASLYPGYGETEVGATMRQAFGQEVDREKQRLAVFTDMLRRGQLVRGAAVPPLPSDPPPSGERSAPGLSPSTPVPPQVVPQSPTKKSPWSDEELAKLSGEHDVPDEQTQIFFSASELEEIREIDSAPQALPDFFSLRPNSQPIASDGLFGSSSWPPPPVHDSAEHRFRPSGTYARAAAANLEPRIDERRIPTMTIRAVQADADVTIEDPPPRGRRVMTLAWLAGLALLLVASAYGLTRVVQGRDATLSIEDLGDPGAVVRVDGVLRGNPPVRVAGLAPGLHEIEVEVSGFEPVRMSVHLEAGEERPLKPVLEPAAPQPAVAPYQAARPDEPNPQGPSKTSSPTSEPPSPVAAPSPERGRPLTPNSGRARLRPAISSDEPGPRETAGDDGVVDDSDVAAEPINQETLAAGQGELLLSTLPWSRVFIDGVDTGRDTPVRSLRVPAGSHVVGLRTPDGAMHDVEVYVEPGKVVTIIRRF